MSDLLEFGVDLDSVRERIDALGYFLSVADIASAVRLIADGIDAIPPAAFVSVANESAEPNRISAGGHSQRVTVDVSILFALGAERADERGREELERARKAVIRQLLAWQPSGALKGFDYVAYQLRETGDGLLWGEVIMRTVYNIAT